VLNSVYDHIHTNRGEDGYTSSQVRTSARKSVEINLNIVCQINQQLSCAINSISLQLETRSCDIFDTSPVIEDEDIDDNDNDDKPYYYRTSITPQTYPFGLSSQCSSVTRICKGDYTQRRSRRVLNYTIHCCTLRQGDQIEDGEGCLNPIQMALICFNASGSLSNQATIKSSGNWKITNGYVLDQFYNDTLYDSRRTSARRFSWNCLVGEPLRRRFRSCCLELDRIWISKPLGT